MMLHSRYRHTYGRDHAAYKGMGSLQRFLSLKNQNSFTIHYIDKYFLLCTAWVESSVVCIKQILPVLFIVCEMIQKNNQSFMVLGNTFQFNNYVGNCKNKVIKTLGSFPLI